MKHYLFHIYDEEFLVVDDLMQGFLSGILVFAVSHSSNSIYLLSNKVGSCHTFGWLNQGQFGKVK